MRKLIVSSSPHIHSSESISSIMLDVIIALIPASLMGVYYFGYRASMVILTAIASCVASEYLYEKLLNKKNTTRDLSAMVTGLLLALNMPATIPLWMVVVGSVFAIVVVKQLYGGLGKNFMNPALAARCFMLIAWTGAMTNFAAPLATLTGDGVSSATPLAVLKGTTGEPLPFLSDIFYGRIPGCIGETSSAMLLLGGLYLLARKVITWHIPVVYIGGYAILSYFFGENLTSYSQLYYTIVSLCSGGLLLGAIFMATDYVTTPTTKNGQIVFAIGCAILTFVIRKFGSYPEGTSFAIILMNLVTPLIERYIKPVSYGTRFIKLKGRG